MDLNLASACRKDEESLLLDYTASTKWEDIAEIEWSTAEVMEVMRQYRSLVEEKFTSTNSKSMPCFCNKGERFRQAGVYKYCPHCGNAL